MLHIIGKKLKKVCLLHWNLIVFTVCMGWYMIDCVEETKKLGVLKKKQESCLLEKQWSTMLTKQKQWR